MNSVKTQYLSHKLICIISTFKYISALQHKTHTFKLKRLKQITRSLKHDNIHRSEVKYMLKIFLIFYMFKTVNKYLLQ